MVAGLVQRSQWPHERVNPLVSAGRSRRFRGLSPGARSPLLRSPPAGEHLTPSRGAGTEQWAKAASLQVQMRASATHHYYIVVPSALQRRGAGSGRGGFTSSARASLQFPKLPQLLGAGEPPAPASAERGPPRPRPGPARPPPRGSPRGSPRPPDPERGPAARCRQDGSLRARPEPSGEGQAGARGALFPN